VKEIRWTPAAVADLEQISKYLEIHFPQFRLRTLRRLYAEIKALKASPKRGRVGAEDGTRELVFSPLPYIAVYRVMPQGVEVLRIYHGAQDWM